MSTLQRITLRGDGGHVYPESFFTERPEWLDGGTTKLHVDPETHQAAGYFYTKDMCIIDGNEGECWSPPPSPTGFEVFHQGTVQTDKGPLSVGVIGAGGEHADPYASVQAAAWYYADVSKQVLVGRCYEDEYGGYFLGAMVAGAGLDGKTVDLLNRSSLSGDWRWRQRMVHVASGKLVSGYDCLGPWVVTRPGLPLDRRGFTRRASVEGGGVSDTDRPVYFSCGSPEPTVQAATTQTDPEEEINVSKRAIELNGQWYELTEIEGAPKTAALDGEEMAEPMDDGTNPDEVMAMVAQLTERVDQLDAALADVMMQMQDGAAVDPVDGPPEG